MQYDSAGTSADRHTRDLQILNAVAESLNSATDVRQALEQTLGLVAELLGLQTGWVWLMDRDTGRFYSAAAQNLPPYLQQPVRMTGKPCWCILSFQAGKLAPKNIDVLECSRLQPAVRAGALDQTRGLRYHASIPLYFRRAFIAIVNVSVAHLAEPVGRRAATVLHHRLSGRDRGGASSTGRRETRLAGESVPALRGRFTTR